MRKAISEDTRTAVLEVAWDLMAGSGRLDATLSDIAAAAGVSRQTLFYGFGSRAGLLVAMARHQDERGPHVGRMAAIARGQGADAQTLHDFVDAWLRYLPHVYPVAIQLESASLTDADAAAAWTDRFLAKGLRGGYEMILKRMAAAGVVAGGQRVQRLADLCLSLTVPSAWRLLVVEAGWSAQAFAASRHALIDAALSESAPGAARPSKARRTAA